jgi:hypothetical protein
MFRLLIIISLSIALLLPSICADPELMLWVKAEDLNELDDQTEITSWPDASGKFNNMKVVTGSKPTFVTEGTSGRPAVVFSGNCNGNDKAPQKIVVPISGEWRGITVFVVGNNLSQSNWFGTHGGPGELRLIGAIQHCGSNATTPGFGAMSKKTGTQLAEIACGIDETGACTLTNYINGAQAGTKSSTNPNYGIVCDQPYFGGYEDWMSYQGEINEIIIYKGVLNDKARKETEDYLLAKYELAKSTEKTPKVPFGYAPPKEPTPPPAVKSKPVLTGLQMWACADDIDANEKGPVENWPTLTGEKKPISAMKNCTPTLIKNSINGHAVVRFREEFSGKKRTSFSAVELPYRASLAETTMIFVGRNLGSIGLIDTAPNTINTLRHIGSLQMPLGSKLGGVPFHSMGGSETSLGIITVGKLPKEGQYLSTYAYGYPQLYKEDTNSVKEVLFQKPVIGVINRGESGFNGDLAEVLIYDRALTDEERYQTSLYLAEKYAFPLKSPKQVASEPKPRSNWSLSYTQLPRTCSWLGNTEDGIGQWKGIQHGIFTICVMPDGTVGAISVWDEAHKEIGFYKDGKSVTGTGGGGGALVSDGKYLYAGVSGMGNKKVGVRRLTMDLKEEPWTALGDAKWIYFDTPEIWQETCGLAVSNGELFVTADKTDNVFVFDAATGAKKRDLAIKSPGRITTDKDGNLWVGTPDGAVQYDPQGKATGKKVAGVTVGGLAIDPQGRLLIAERGDRQQVIIYDISGAQPKEVSTIGKRGGILAAKGVMSDDCLLDPNGVGVDAAGNIYVYSAYRILSYTPQGVFRWKVECNVFCQVADFDPAADGNDVYYRNFHYRAVPNEKPGKDWSWVGYTADTKRFPEAGEGGPHTIIRRWNNTLYRVTMGGQINFARKEPGTEIFIPCAAVVMNEGSSGYKRLKDVPEKGRYIWTDLNGNGLAEKEEIVLPPADAPRSEWSSFNYVDSKGDLWEPQGRKGMRTIPLKGFTDKGTPIYDWAGEKIIPRPAEFIEVRRVMYYPESDTMYLGGYTWDCQQWPGEMWIDTGREVIRYDDWSKPTRKVAGRIPFIPVNVSSYDILPSRDLLFYCHVDSSTIFIVNTKTGKTLGIIEPDPDVVGTDIGWVDMPGGGIHVFERKNGEIVVMEEESYKERQIVYRLPKGFENYVPPK